MKFPYTIMAAGEELGARQFLFSIQDIPNECRPLCRIMYRVAWIPRAFRLIFLVLNLKSCFVQDCVAARVFENLPVRAVKLQEHSSENRDALISSTRRRAKLNNSNRIAPRLENIVLKVNKFHINAGIGVAWRTNRWIRCDELFRKLKQY